MRSCHLRAGAQCTKELLFTSIEIKTDKTQKDIKAQHYGSTGDRKAAMDMRLEVEFSSFSSSFFGGEETWLVCRDTDDCSVAIAALELPPAAVVAMDASMVAMVAVVTVPGEDRTPGGGRVRAVVSKGDDDGLAVAGNSGKRLIL